MADDRIDLDEWAGWIYRAVEDETDRDVSGYRHVRSAIAAALREAHEAGLRERIDVLDCDACGERHMTERGAAMASENRELRRELAALEYLCDWCSWNEGTIIVVGGHKVLRVLAGPQCSAWPEERTRALTYAELARAEGWGG